MRMDKDHIYSPGIHIPFHTLTSTDHAYITTEWKVWMPSAPVQASVVMTMEHNGQAYGYRGFDLEHMDLKPGQWNTVRTLYLTPEVRSKNDPLLVYFWLRDAQHVLVRPPTFLIQEPVSAP
jgi:hypothetical protein